MEIVSTIIMITYVGVLAYLYLGIRKHPPIQNEIDVAPITKFSIIIPFRNEELHLPALLRSFKALSYPKDQLEFLFVNDESSDSSEIVVNQFCRSFSTEKGNARLLQNKRISKSPKKDAISYGIEVASHAWIITTDADCVVPEQWLATLDRYIQKHQPKMVCGPVVFKSNSSFWQEYQQLDGLALQAVAMGSFLQGRGLLCNGANLAYLKECFHSVGGFEGNNHLASGDDMFLLQKINTQFPKDVHYLGNPQALVATASVNNFPDLINQRIRWASKTTALKNSVLTRIGACIFLTNLWVIILTIGLVVDLGLIWMVLAVYLLKFCIDALLLTNTSRILKIPISWTSLVGVFFLVPWITCWVTIYSFWGHYQWKGRRFARH